jgi:hypothetical protein
MFQADDLMPSSALARRDEYLWRITRTSVAGVVVIVVDLKAVEEEEEEEAEVVMVRIVDLSLYLTNPTVDIPPPFAPKRI